MEIAGIVLYNPDREKLRANIQAVISQVDWLVLVDNGSCNYRLIFDEFQDDKIAWIRHDENLGIARALNDIVLFAREKGASWVLSLDQDSVVSSNIIEKYEESIVGNNIGMICCCIMDRNLANYNFQITNTIRVVQSCISSGCYINIRAWERVGGYYEPLFIDQVDFDMCYLLNENGYKIVRNESVYISHEVGHSREIKFLGKADMVTNHPPIRYYYLFRNYIVVARRHGHWLHFFYKMFRRLLIINIYEQKRSEKNQMILWGLYDAITFKLGPFSH